MEYIAGGSLEAHLETKQGRLPPAESAEIVRQAALGLQAAHEMKLVHRDVKPANLLLDGAGRVRVADFGLARTTEPDRTRLTASNGVVGTPSYMSPEHISSPDQVDCRSDVYSLGAVLYECLTGQPPFSGTTFMVIRQVLEDEPKPPRQLNEKVSRDLETICLKCLHKEPARRYGSARELADDLERYLAGKPVQARPTGSLTRMARWCRRRPLTAAALAFAVVSLLAGTIVSLLLERRATRALGEVARKEREAKQALAETELVLAHGLLRPLAGKGIHHDAEVLLLQELASLDSGRERVRLLFLDEGMKRAGAARGLGERLNRASHAAIGLSPRRREAVLSLAQARLDDSNTPPAGRRLAARLVALLASRQPALVLKAAQTLLEPGCEFGQHEGAMGNVAEIVPDDPADETRRVETSGCLNALRMLVVRLEPAQISQLARTIETMLWRETTPDRLTYLAAAYSIVRPTGGDRLTGVTRKVLLRAAFSPPIESSMYHFPVWAALAPRLSDQEARLHAMLLAILIECRLSFGEFTAPELDGPLHDLSRWLNSATAEHFLNHLVDFLVVRAAKGTEFAFDSAVFDALSDRLKPAGATRLARRVLGASEEVKFTRDLGRGFWSLSAKVEPAAAAELAERITRDMASIREAPGCVFALDRLMVHLTPGERRRLIGRLLRHLEGKWSQTHWWILKAFPRLLARLPPQEARQAASWLASLLIDAAKADGTDDLGMYGSSYIELEPWLSRERSRKEAQFLMSRVRVRERAAARAIDFFEEEENIPLLVRTSPKDALAAATALMRRGYPPRGKNLQMLAEQLSLDELVELLRWPISVRSQRATLLAECSRRTGQTFADLWELVEYLKEHAPHIDLDAPVSRGVKSALD
jgi:hypothetical protein